MKQLKTFFVHLSLLVCTFLLCGCPGGGSDYSLVVSTRNIELSNKVKTAEFTVTGRFGEDNAQWTITKNGDDFVDLSLTSGYGTEKITVTSKDINQKEELQCNLTIVCGDQTANVLIKQQYVVDPEMTVDIDDSYEILQMSEGIVCQVNYGKKISNCYMALYDTDRIPTNDKDVINDIKIRTNKKFFPSYPESITTDGNMTVKQFQTNPVVAWYENIESNHSYTIVFVPYDANGNVGMVTRQEVTTATKNQPLVNVTDVTIINKNGTDYYQWLFTPNTSTDHYYSYVCVGSKEFESYKRDDKGLLAAWFMLPRLKQITTDDIYFLKDEHFNVKDTEWCNEYLIPKQIRAGEYSQLEKQSGHKYIQIVTLGFSNNDDYNYSKMVNVVNAEIRESDPGNPGQGTQVIIMDGVNRGDFSELGSLDKTNYTLSASVSSLSYGADVSSQTISITSNDSWDVATTESWISVDKSYGSGNGTIKVSVSKNTSSSRKGTVTVTGRNSGKKLSITINQDAPAYSLTATPTTLYFASSKESKDISITSNDSWTISTSSSWLTLSKKSGSGNSSFTVTASANSGSERSGNITITGTYSGKTVSVSVTQAKSSEINLEDFPDDSSLDAKGNNIEKEDYGKDNNLD